MTRDISGAMEIIQGYEGLSGRRSDGKFYPVHEDADPPNVYTIGKGHVVKPHETVEMSKGLTLKQVGEVFLKDLGSRIPRLERYIPGATDRQFSAMLSLFYNNEASIAKGSPGIFYRNEQHQRAAAAMLLYVNSRPDGKTLVPQLGLWRRRMTEALYYLTGEIHIAKTPKAEDDLYRKVTDLGLISILKELEPNHPFIRAMPSGGEIVYGKTPHAESIQRFLNKLGYSLTIDGWAGAKTSDAYKKASGHYLKGDPRAND